MGDLTRGQIVSEGGLQAGRSDLTTRLNIYFNAWLRSVYTSWDWPFLKKRKTSLSLPTGTTSVSVGDGSSSITNEIKRILDPITVYDSTYSTKAIARIKQLTGTGDLLIDEVVNNPSTFKGLPTNFKIRSAATWGKWEMIPIPFPDRDYLLAFDYIEVPAALTSDSDVPVYPNDQTMIQAIVAQVHKYANGVASPEFQAAMDLLGVMVVDDRQKFGIVPGTNDILQLDTSVFK